MNHPSTYRNKEVVVLGLALSGVAVAKLFDQQGARVTASDRKAREECPEADELEALGISVLCGGHPDGLIHEGVSLLVKNPGIPYSAPPVQKALELGIEVVTEVEVAFHICEAPIIGITGSNGKTTTTTWVGKILEAAGQKPVVAGNIGVPLCDAAQTARKENIMVVELSSFQLKGTRSFRPHISCLLNIYETHLDYHRDMDDYIASKARIFANQTSQDIAVLNWDDEICRRLAPEIRAHIVPFSMKEPLDYGVYVRKEEEGEVIVGRVGQGEPVRIVEVSRLGIPGSHNIENALAATAISLAAGADPEAVARMLQDFRGVEHRLEFVAQKEGVAYYNNSKATNPAATLKAIESFGKPIVLIAGGQERFSDLSVLLPYFRDRVKSVDTGNSAADILDEAVRAARDFAEAGDIVLLSPACASWDMFSSYEERGRMFKESVHNL